jgi:hypothetical protein
MSTTTRRVSLHLRLLAGLLGVIATGCGNDTSTDEGGGRGAHAFPTTSIVFGEDSSITTYLSLLPSLDSQDVDYDKAREFPGWADLWVHGGGLFVTDGEAPALTRFSMGDDGDLEEGNRISFANHGADTAAFWRNVFVSATKAYLFIPDAREVVIWDPEALEITGTFALPELDDRGPRKAYVTIDRGAVVRDDRLYVTVGWGDWENYSLADDSAILVIDTKRDKVLDTLPVSCPDLNVATSDDRGNLYFSNWVYGITPVLFERGAHTCAVRIKAGQDVVDEDWSLTFADVTDGREAAALRFIGDGKALMSVFYEEQVELDAEVDRAAVVDSASWRFWTLDLETLEAAELEDIDWHGGGYYSTRIEDQSMLFVPSGDYSSTTAYELFSDGRLEERWEAMGWVTRLFALRH